MNTSSHYYTIAKPAVAEFKDRGSSFIAYAYPLSTIAEFKERLAALKKEHPKAAHYCFAYRIGTDGNTFRASDDGEPSGSAGKPILGQLDSKQVTNTMVIVVRYFGGTLLGVPGLINAYRTVTAEAIQTAGVIEKPVLINYRLEFDYTRMNEVMTVIKDYDCLVLSRDTQLFCVLNIAVPKNKEARLAEILKEMQGVESCRQN